MSHRLTCPNCQHVDIREELPADSVIICGQCQAVIPFAGDDRPRWHELKGLGVGMVLLPITLAAGIVTYRWSFGRRNGDELGWLLFALFIISTASVIVFLWRSTKKKPDLVSLPIFMGGVGATIGSLILLVALVALIASSPIGGFLLAWGLFIGAVWIIRGRGPVVERLEKSFITLITILGFLITGVLAALVLVFFTCVSMKQ